MGTSVSVPHQTVLECNKVSPSSGDASSDEIVQENFTIAGDHQLLKVIYLTVPRISRIERKPTAIKPPLRSSKPQPKSDLYPSDQFHCAPCFMTFTYKRYLMQHINARHHDGGKRFRCELCGKHFVTEEDRETHARVHRMRPKDKPFPCAVEGCSRGFINKHDLLRHQQTIHGSPERCPECPKTFTRPDHLRRHIAVTHEGKPATKRRSKKSKHVASKHENRSVHKSEK